MLNKPKFMSPSINMAECTVDLTSEDGVEFSCIIDGNEAIRWYQIKVYLMSDNSLVYDTGKKELDPPFFPIDERNRNVVFRQAIESPDEDEWIPAVETDYNSERIYYQHTENSNEYSISPVNSGTWSTYKNDLYYKGFVNRSEPYYWTVQVWSGNDISTAKSCEEVFYANTTPVVTLQYKQQNNKGDYNDFELDGTDVLKSNHYLFKAKYSQKENIQLKRYGWRLKDVSSNETLIDTITQNQIYGTADNILLSYNGLLNDSTYSLEVYIETQNNATLTADAQFTVSYATTFLSTEFKTVLLTDEPGVNNSWGEAKIIEGVPSFESPQYISNYPINEKKSIVIPKGGKIEYSTDSLSGLEIPDDAYIVLSMQIFPEFQNTDLQSILHMEGDIPGGKIIRELNYMPEVSEDGAYLIYNIGWTSHPFKIEQFKYYFIHKPSAYVWYIITLSPLDANNPLTVVEIPYKGGLPPSENLYPATNLYPRAGGFDPITYKEV